MAATDIFETLAGINGILKNWDRDDIQNFAVYKNPLFDRLKKVSDPESVHLGAGGRGSMATNKPMNAMPRTELGNVPLPMKHTFGRFTFSEVEIVNSVGITKWELEEAGKGEQSALDLSMFKQDEAKDDLRWRLGNAARGDGTGRLAQVSSINGSGASGGTLTCDNTVDTGWGWNLCDHMEDGMLVDVYKVAANTNAYDQWTLKVSGGVVSSLNKRATPSTASFVLTGRNASTGAPEAFTAAVEVNDIIFMHGTVIVPTSGDITHNEVMGLIGICDDGTSSWVGSTPGTDINGGAMLGDGHLFQGLDRTAYRQLKARVTINPASTGMTPASFDLETILGEIRASFRGGNIGKFACYGSDNMIAAVARKAAGAMNAFAQVDDGKVTGGYYTEALRCGNKLVPLIPMENLPPNTIFGVHEDDLVVHQSVPINWVIEDGRGPFVRATYPNDRNFTYEAWLRTKLQIVAKRCDNCFRLTGLIETD